MSFSTSTESQNWTLKEWKIENSRYDFVSGGETPKHAMGISCTRPQKSTSSYPQTIPQFGQSHRASLERTGTMQRPLHSDDNIDPQPSRLAHTTRETCASDTTNNRMEPLLRAPSASEDLHVARATCIENENGLFIVSQNFPAAHVNPRRGRRECTRCMRVHVKWHDEIRVEDGVSWNEFICIRDVQRMSGQRMAFRSVCIRILLSIEDVNWFR